MAKPYVCFGRTSAKSAGTRGNPKPRIKVLCPVCNLKIISLTPSEFAKRTENGTKLISCSRKCGKVLMRMRKTGVIV
jgi:hypothetical protein